MSRGIYFSGNQKAAFRGVCSIQVVKSFWLVLVLVKYLLNLPWNLIIIIPDMIMRGQFRVEVQMAK